jgi:uncharacterized membrane protein
MYMRYLFANRFARPDTYAFATFLAISSGFTPFSIPVGLSAAAIMYALMLLVIYFTTKDYRAKTVSCYDAISILLILLCLIHIGVIAWIVAFVGTMALWFYAHAKHPEWFE